MIVDLAPDEIYLIREALESAEYWEHRDQLQHDSGYITDPTQADNGEWIDSDDNPLDEEAQAAWASVLALRAVDTKLAALTKEIYAPAGDAGPNEG